MRTSNPALSEETFARFGAYESSARMTMEGTAMKTGFLVMLAFLSAAFTWDKLQNGAGAVVMPLVIGGAITGMIFGFVTVFKPTWSPTTAPIYALAEGFVLGAISQMAEVRFPGIAFQAVLLTFCTLFSMLVIFRLGLIRATEGFKLGIVAATGGICMVYIVTMVLSIFGMHVPYIHQAGPIGIGFSLFVVVIAALNLVLDFDFIEQGARRGAPKFMEWYGAFSLMVTLVWLYMEVLRLLAKLRDRD